MFPKWAWSWSCKQFLHCRLRENFATASRRYTGDIHNSSVVGFLWHLSDNESDLIASWLSAHCPTVTVQLHNFHLFRTCRIRSFCTVAWQLARFQLTWRIAWSLGNSWAACTEMLYYCIARFQPVSDLIYSVLLLATRTDTAVQLHKPHSQWS